MNGRKVGRLRSLFILVSLATVGAVVANCGGDDTGTTPGTGGSSGSGGSAGTGGTDAGTGGLRDAGNDARDASLGGDASADRVVIAERAADAPPTDAQIAACTAGLVDAGVEACLTRCFCNACPVVASQCLTNQACRDVANCALATGCAVPDPLNCLTSEICGPLINSNPTVILAAIAFGSDPCAPACVVQCSADVSVDATPGSDATPSPDAQNGDATSSDATSGDATSADDAAADGTAEAGD